MKSHKLLIGGEWISGANQMSVVNPMTGKDIGRVPQASDAEVSQAVEAAKAVLPRWRRLNARRKARYLLEAAQLLRDMKDTPSEGSVLALTIHEEVGKPLPEARVEITEAADIMAFFAEIGPAALRAKHLSLDAALWPAKQSYMVYEPCGVVAIIKPWNYPLETPLWAIAPALMAGNTVVFKPSEYSSTVGIEIGKLFQSVGLPAGVLNVVTGDKSTGKALTAHPDVAMVSFTGSVRSGEDVAMSCAKTHKRCSLELGGNDAAIVCGDANTELTANGLVWGAFTNAGQVCAGIKRAYVHKRVAEPLIARVVELTKGLIIGRDVGPLISRNQLEKIEEFVQDAVGLGAQVLAGGKRAAGEGFFYLPTILTGIHEPMRVLKEEAFGPLLPICVVKDEREAIQQANASEYGLGASIWTSNVDKGRLMAAELEVGMVWVNDVNLPFPQAPWSGLKNSGPGIELSVDGLYEFVVKKHISIDTSSGNKREWWFPY